MTTDTVPKTGRRATATRLHRRRHGQGRGHARPRPGHDARRVSPPTPIVDAGRPRPRRCARRRARTFDRVDSDGCMSTNDTVLLLACGASGVAPDRGRVRTRGARRSAPTWPASSSPTPRAPARHRHRGRPARRARTTPSTVARAVARSNLFKCAIHGEDPNWGRVLAAVGTTDAASTPTRLDVTHQRRLGLPGRRRRRGPRRRSTCPGRRRHDRRRPARRRRRGDRLDQRPHRRLRPRELGVLHMSDST